MKPVAAMRAAQVAALEQRVTDAGRMSSITCLQQTDRQMHDIMSSRPNWSEVMKYPQTASNLADMRAVSRCRCAT